ncbi:MAG: hypothetical protein ABI649_08050 [Gaiellaceae bacterium]
MRLFLVAKRAERDASYWCDAVVERANAARVRGIDVAAPPKLVFRWLCQLRVSSYSYEWADPGGRRSPRYLLPGLDEVELGQAMMGPFELVHFVPGRELTVRLERRRMQDLSLGRWYAPAALTYRLSESELLTGSRLVVKSVAAFPRGARWAILRRIVAPLDAALLRRQLRTLKRLAERDWATESERVAAALLETPLPVLTVPAREREPVAG